MILSSSLVVVTGGSSGIGLATARRFAATGARVCLVSNVQRDLEVETAAIGPRSCARCVDLSRPDERAALIASIESEHGPADVLVNCAGIGYHASVAELDPNIYRLLFEVNFFALIDLSQQALGAMSARRRGHIVNVTSASARRSLRRMGAYAASKAAAHAFTQTLRLEAAPLGVGVSEVMPISVGTNFFRDSAAGGGGRGYRPRGLVQTPERIAELIFRAVRDNRAEVCSHLPTALSFALDALAPNWVARLLERFDRQGIDPRGLL